MTEPHLHAPLAIAGVVAALAAAFDLRTGEIPNGITYPALAAGPLVHIARVVMRTRGFADEIVVEALHAIGGILLCGLVPLLLYRRGAMNAGDVKLLASLGGLLQPMLGIEAELYAFTAATLVAPAMLAYHGKLLRTLKQTFAIVANMFLPKEKHHAIDETAFSWLRLGPAVLLGVLFTAYMHW